MERAVRARPSVAPLQPPARPASAHTSAPAAPLVPPTGDPDASRSRDALIHSFYGQECANPVHVAVDTSGRGGRMSVRAFVSRALGIGGRELAREFLEVRGAKFGVAERRFGVAERRQKVGVVGENEELTMYGRATWE